MGRKTLEAPNRYAADTANQYCFRRDKDFKIKGVIAVHSVEEALEAASAF